MRKEKTKNPFNNKGFSYEAWQSGYDSDLDTKVENPYTPEAGDLRSFWELGRKAKEQDMSVIPKGLYCHGPLVQEGKKPNGLPIFKAPKMCPYWSSDKNLPNQGNGCCSFLGVKDGDTVNDKKVWLLWDQVKECGINMDDEDEESED